MYGVELDTNVANGSELRKHSSKETRDYLRRDLYDSGVLILNPFFQPLQEMENNLRDKLDRVTATTRQDNPALTTPYFPGGLRAGMRITTPLGGNRFVECRVVTVTLSTRRLIKNFERSQFEKQLENADDLMTQISEMYGKRKKLMPDDTENLWSSISDWAPPTPRGTKKELYCYLVTRDSRQDMLAFTSLARMIWFFEQEDRLRLEWHRWIDEDDKFKHWSLTTSEHRKLRLQGVFHTPIIKFCVPHPPYSSSKKTFFCLHLADDGWYRQARPVFHYPSRKHSNPGDDEEQFSLNKSAHTRMNTDITSPRAGQTILRSLYKFRNSSGKWLKP